MMRVAVLHYHYRPGGVTRVIQNSLAALGNFKGLEIQAIQVPGTDYGEPANLRKDPRALATELMAKAKHALGSTPNLWHIHNPTLGKHPAFPQLIRDMAAQGIPMLLHIHDFPEDGRPSNYRLMRDLPVGVPELYPVAPHIHYGTINLRDHDILLQAGIPSTNLHHLPNPVIFDNPVKTISKSENFCPGKQLHFYPVRATRRKNIGETLLWATLARDGHHFATSIGPTNLAHMKEYGRWQALNSHLGLPMSLGLCEDPRYPFPEVARSAHTCLTTSLAEGFGLTFLEPILTGLPLWGRDLPEITGDFRQHGISLQNLYNRVEIPLEWVGAPGLKGKIHSKLVKTYALYGQTIPDDAVEKAWESFTRGSSSMDFGRLDQGTQSQVIRKLHSEPQLHKDVSPSQPFMEIPPAIPAQADIVLEQYSPANCAAKLHMIYQALSNASPYPPSFLDPTKILAQFLNPARFSFQLT